MTRNGLVEENLATKETRKVTNSDQELSYKQKDVEQAFITSEKKKNSHKKAEKKQFSEKVQEGNPAKKEEAANSPPGKRKTQGRYRYRDKPAGVSVDSAVEIRERKEKHRSQYQRQKKKQQRLQFGKLETDGSLKKLLRVLEREKLRLKQMEDIFRQRRMMFLQTEKKESRNIAEKQ